MDLYQVSLYRANHEEPGHIVDLATLEGIEECEQLEKGLFLVGGPLMDAIFMAFVGDGYAEIRWNDFVMSIDFGDME
jgi:hypothetical protein